MTLLRRPYTFLHNTDTLSDINECKVNTTNDCEQICVNLNGSHECICDTGYGLNDDNKTCFGKFISYASISLHTLFNIDIGLV